MSPASRRILRACSFRTRHLGGRARPAEGAGTGSSATRTNRPRGLDVGRVSPAKPIRQATCDGSRITLSHVLLGDVRIPGGRCVANDGDGKARAEHALGSTRRGPNSRQRAPPFRTQREPRDRGEGVEAQLCPAIGLLVEAVASAVAENQYSAGQGCQQRGQGNPVGSRRVPRGESRARQDAGRQDRRRR